MRDVAQAFAHAALDGLTSLIDGLVNDPVASVEASYNKPGAASINATSGTVTNTPTTRNVRLYRGNLIETESPSPESAVEQFIVRRCDLERPTSISPSRGDYVEVGSDQYRVDKVEDGKLGETIVYHLLHTTKVDA